jgi:hypothetical protein
MARVRNSSLTQSSLEGLAGAPPSQPSITGIDGLDRVLYQVSDSLKNLDTALNITTVASTVAALTGVLLLIRTRK